MGVNRRLGTPRSCRSSKFPRGAQHPDSTPQGARPLSPHNFEAGTSGPSSCCRFRAKDSRVPGSSARIDTAEEEAPRLKKVLTLYNILYCYILLYRKEEVCMAAIKKQMHVVKNLLIMNNL